jgi:hypothetical protein
VTISGGTATITFDGKDDQITLEMESTASSTLAFADGTQLVVEP